MHTKIVIILVLCLTCAVFTDAAFHRKHWNLDPAAAYQTATEDTRLPRSTDDPQWHRSFLKLEKEVERKAASYGGPAARGIDYKAALKLIQDRVSKVVRNDGIRDKSAATTPATTDDSQASNQGEASRIALVEIQGSEKCEGLHKDPNKRSRGQCSPDVSEEVRLMHPPATRLKLCYPLITFKSPRSYAWFLAHILKMLGPARDRSLATVPPVPHLPPIPRLSAPLVQRSAHRTPLTRAALAGESSYGQSSYGQWILQKNGDRVFL